MLFESLGLPRTVYQLEVWKYSEYSEGSEGHSELAKLASEGGLEFHMIFLTIKKRFRIVYKLF